ncbi:peptidoglycan editing factor PgeF [Patescibacteria group bacterium]|nr:peptidoglycan editing factor PgeF [Patescibacteria group bacterium]MBU1703587.1 peptidoglycan editing factor PgeF [Patescibacteria group bacterium]MBU1953674.1 peptidoglycan editing factor PgeF [Patescibacteria group bacterium]
MRKVFFQNVQAYQFHLLQKFSDQVSHAVFSRNGGVSSPPYDSLNVRYGIGDSHSNVDENRKIILKVLGFKRLVSANQTHGKNVLIVDDEFLNFQPAGVEPDDIDAFVTDARGVALMIQVADCQAILMYDPKKQVVAAVHAGWKGLAADISGETLTVMRMNFGCNPADLLVCISPSLGPESAFFSNPEEELPSSFAPFIDSQKRVDLWEFSTTQLQSHGVRKRNIELARICTQRDNGENFFSFRGEGGITGRFGVVIGLPEL